MYTEIIFNEIGRDMFAAGLRGNSNKEENE